MVVARIQLFEVLAFHIFHRQVQMSIEFAMLDIADDAMMIVDAGKDFRPPKEPAAREQIKPQAIMQTAQGISFAVPIRGEPNISHAPAVNQLLQVKSSEWHWSPRGGRFFFARCTKHRVYL